MIMGEVKEIQVVEIAKAGSQILIKCMCPKCKYVSLHRFSPMFECDNCNYEACDVFWNTDQCRYRNIACSSDKITRRPRKKTIETLKKAQGELCAYCNTDIKNEYEIDHIRPFSAGGDNSLGNICLCCSKCNSIAGSLWFNSFDQKRLYIVSKSGHRRTHLW